MARTRSLAELQTETLQLADMESVTNYVDTTADTGEVARYINQGIAELYDLIIESAGEEWYMFLDTSITTVAGTDTYALPANFYILRGVDHIVDANTSVPISPYNFLDRHQDTYLSAYAGGSNPRGFPMQYRLTGTLGGAGEGEAGDYQPEIRFTPMPQAAYNIRLWYFEHAPELSGNDTWDGFNGWEEYVTVFAAIKLRAKEESDYSDLMLRKQELKERIADMSSNRDLGRNEHIYDVEGDFDYSDGHWGGW